MLTNIEAIVVSVLLSILPIAVVLDANAANESDQGNPYCDLVPDDYTGNCHDRKDYSDDTGLYPCRDGSNVEDWRDCTDAGSHPDETEVEIESSGRPSCDDVPAGTNCDDKNDEDSTVTYTDEGPAS